MAIIRSDTINKLYENVFQYTRYNGDIVYILAYKYVDILGLKARYDWIDGKFVSNDFKWYTKKHDKLIIFFDVSRETWLYFDLTETIVLYPLDKFVETDIKSLDETTISYLKRYGHHYICFT